LAKEVNNAKMKIGFHRFSKVGMLLMDDIQGKSGKLEWRRRMSLVRDELTPDERERRSIQLCNQLEVEILSPLRSRLGRPLSLCVYAPFRSEASPLALLNTCWEMGDLMVAPRILPAGEGMELRKVEALSNWIPGKWGIQEPDLLQTSLMDRTQPLDVVLVPGIAFNEKGGRLGYGGGYYDRMYAEEQAKSNTGTLWIGFAFSIQVVPEPLPMEPHDLRLDVLATDKQIIWVNKGEK
jgi:5-formyltetrahydrofolate cyclo-ligase